jgi:glycosyltransferase involved in cell wall biosynthesis
VKCGVGPALRRRSECGAGAALASPCFGRWRGHHFRLSPRRVKLGTLHGPPLRQARALAPAAPFHRRPESHRPNCPYTGHLRLTALTIRGPLRGSSGHARHVREFTAALRDRAVEVELRDVPEWRQDRLPDRSDERFDHLRAICDSDVALHFCMPHQVARISGKLNVNFTMFEATRVPAPWVDLARKVDLVIVPTESSRAAWVHGGTPEDRVRICPLGVDADFFRAGASPLPLPASSRSRRFLNVSDLNPRKNLDGLLRAWADATTPEDDAALILKVGGPGALPPIDVGEAAPVVVLRQTFGRDEMPRLYASATHYISLSHGEGWDLPMMEAGACGLRLIAPDHSAYPAYLDRSIAALIPSPETPAVYDGDPATAALFAGANWWTPGHEEAVAAIRRSIRGEDTPAASARDCIATRFTWAQAADRLLEILDELQPRIRQLRLVEEFRASRKPAAH